jgi:DtxR family transcriptional regulator, Mn-dependent transcriptional regulator
LGKIGFIDSGCALGVPKPKVRPLERMCEAKRPVEVTLSKSERELLKALYRLSQTGTEAHTSEVAVRVGVTPGTVTAGVKRLADRELVIHRPYRGIELTPTGRMYAVSVIRRHRIVERFLSDMLNYSWQDADRLSMSFEHQLPQEVEDRLFKALDCPETCPHGFPIPAPDSLELPLSLRITQLSPGEAAVIALPGDMDSDVVAFLETLGMRPGARIELREKQPFDGPVVVRVDGEDRTVGERLAERIHVVPGVQTEEAAS